MDGYKLKQQLTSSDKHEPEITCACALHNASKQIN